MTNRLVIRSPQACVTFDSDDKDKIIRLSEFCKTELGAFHSSENVEELTVEELSQEMSNKFYSFAFKLGLL